MGQATDRRKDSRGSGVQESMTIGRLARAAGVNVETIRYYQRRGLVPEPDRPLGGQRRYPRSVLERIAFIRRAQRLGFSLEEVRRLIELDGSRRSPESRLLAERKLAVVETRIAELHAMRRKLKALVAASRRNPRAGSCPILAALREDDASDV